MKDSSDRDGGCAVVLLIVIVFLLWSIHDRMPAPVSVPATETKRSVTP